jgi:CheY-like chemotaxis protein
MSKLIVFVDDEPSFIDALIAGLEGRNYECKHFSDMSSALKFINSSNVSLVVTDIMMPSGVDFPQVDSSETGFFLIEKLLEKKTSFPIICLSVIGDQEKIQKLKRKNVLYLRKGETPLETAMKLIESKIKGVYSSE